MPPHPVGPRDCAQRRHQPSTPDGRVHGFLQLAAGTGCGSAPQVVAEQGIEWLRAARSSPGPLPSSASTSGAASERSRLRRPQRASTAA
jgi:hypothetical protein